MEHKYIDFTSYILGKKLREGENYFKMTDVALSNMLLI